MKPDVSEGKKITRYRKAVEENLKILEEEEPLSSFLAMTGMIIPGILLTEGTFEGKNVEFYIGIKKSRFWISARENGIAIYGSLLTQSILDQRIYPELMLLLFRSIDQITYELGAQVIGSESKKAMDTVLLAEKDTKDSDLSSGSKLWSIRAIYDLVEVFSLCGSDELGELFFNINGNYFPAKETSVYERDMMKYELGKEIVQLLKKPVGDVVSVIKQNFVNYKRYEN